MKIQIKDKDWAKVLKEGHLPLGEGGEIVEMTSEELKAFRAENKPEPTYIELRNAKRGTIGEQLEYIVENGLEAFIERDTAIRAEFPKEETE